MNRNKLAQKLTYLISEHSFISEPDEQFPHHCIGVRRESALKILDELEKLGFQYKEKKMSRQILAFAGSKGSGKTTAFDVIKNNFENVHEAMLAGNLKKAVCDVFGFDFNRLNDLAYKEDELDEPVIFTRDNLIAIASYFAVEYDYDKHIRKHVGYVCDTLRHILQYIGTDFLRGIDDDIHVKTVLKNLPKEGLVVITDLRFESEFNYFFENHTDEFIPFYVKNSSAELAAEGDNHPSETDLLKFRDKCSLIDNNYSIQEYESLVLTKVKAVA